MSTYVCMYAKICINYIKVLHNYIYIHIYLHTYISDDAYLINSSYNYDYGLSSFIFTVFEIRFDAFAFAYFILLTDVNQMIN